MPSYKPPSQFPGLDQLPGSIRRLTEMVFPQSPEMPTPAATAVGGPLRGLAGLARHPSMSALEDAPVEQLMPSMDDIGGMLGQLGKGLANAPTSLANTMRRVVQGGSASDIMNPRSQETMGRMFKEANPVFKQLQQQGMFQRGK